MKGRGPKVREDELDSPMGHLRKRVSPTWAGVPQLSFMAQATVTSYIMSILNRVDINFNQAIS